MQLSVRQAAIQAGVSRQTLFRYIKEGRISATISHSGEKQIEVSELLRVFGALQPETVALVATGDRSRLSQRDRETPATVTYQIELERLRAQLEIKTAELDLAKERIAELKTRENSATEEKNRLLTLIEQQSRLLSAPSQVERNSAKRATEKKTAVSRTKVVPPARKTVVSTKPPLKKMSSKAAAVVTKKSVASTKTGSTESKSDKGKKRLI